MYDERFATVALALCCALAVGASATTLDASLPTDPDDAVGFDYDDLPIGEDGAGTIREEVNSNRGRLQPSAGATDDDGDVADPGSGATDDDGDAGGGPRGAGEEPTAADGPGEETTGAPSSPLILLLLNLLELLVALVAVGVTLALGYRYRFHLLALARAVAAVVGLRDRERRPATEGAGTEDRGEPADDVQRAWLALVTGAGGDDPEERTPGEWAERALRAGLDPEGVGDVTRAFRHVRYGGGDPDGEPGRLARRGLAKLDAGAVGRVGETSRNGTRGRAGGPRAVAGGDGPREGAADGAGTDVGLVDGGGSP